MQGKIFSFFIFFWTIWPIWLKLSKMHSCKKYNEIGVMRRRAVNEEMWGHYLVLVYCLYLEVLRKCFLAKCYYLSWSTLEVWIKIVHAFYFFRMWNKVRFDFNLVAKVSNVANGPGFLEYYFKPSLAHVCYIERVFNIHF